MAIPKCEKCGRQDKSVKCYEGYGVIARLCPNCDKKYLLKIAELNSRILLDAGGKRITSKSRRLEVAEEIRNWKKENL